MISAEIMNKRNLIKGHNISRYNYYIIRLCSRRNIQLLKEIPDMKNSKTRHKFDDNLFGVVYKELKWDTKYDCPYYKEWLS